MLRQCESSTANRQKSFTGVNLAGDVDASDTLSRVSPHNNNILVQTRRQNILPPNNSNSMSFPLLSCGKAVVRAVTQDVTAQRVHKGSARCSHELGPRQDVMTVNTAQPHHAVTSKRGLDSDHSNRSMACRSIVECFHRHGIPF